MSGYLDLVQSEFLLDLSRPGGPAAGDGHRRCRPETLGHPNPGSELYGDVDNHVFLPSDVAGFADFFEDLPGGDTVAFRSPFSMDQEGGVDAGVALHNGCPVHDGHAGDDGFHDVFGGGHDAVNVDAGVDVQALEGSCQHLGGGVARPGAEGEEGAFDLLRTCPGGINGVGHTKAEVL